MAAERYFDIWREGTQSKTIWGETIIILPNTELPDSAENFKSGLKSNNSSDYPPASLDLISPCEGPDNFRVDRNSSIDTWVNHWIGRGTYMGAISWFHTCPCDRQFSSDSGCYSNPCECSSSAHFVITKEGEIIQMVEVANTSFHAGASGYNNNDRSIGVEHEATVDNEEWWYREPMLQASTEMACFFTSIYDIPPSRGLPGIREHNEMPGTNTKCAGNIPWDDWMTRFNNCTQCPNDPIETDSESKPVDLDITASENCSPISLQGYICQSGDTDYYQTFATGGGILNLTLNTQNTGKNYALVK